MSAEFYDPNSVDLSLGGRIIEGFADGSMIDVEWPKDDYETKVGTKGSVAVTRIYDPTAVITVRLLQTSPSNDALSDLRASGLAATATGFAGDLSLRDASGTSIVQGKAWVMKRPNLTFSNTAEAREWKIGIVTAQAKVGGNTRFA